MTNAVSRRSGQMWAAARRACGLRLRTRTTSHARSDGRGAARPGRRRPGLGLLLLACACGGPVAPPGDDLPGGKVDPLVREQLAAGRERVPTLILGRQLLEPPGGFEEFALENAGGDRRSLRTSVLEALQDLAAREQPAILERLPQGSVRGRLWVVNGVVAELSRGDLASLVELDAVRYIYHAGTPAPVPSTAGPVASTGDRYPGASAGVVPEVPWNVNAVGAPAVWEQHGVTGDGVVVAVLDQGVNVTQPDLRDRIWTNPEEIPDNGVDDDGNGWVDDVQGFNFRDMTAELPGVDTEHGTWVSGIVAGDGTGGIRTGIAPGSRLMILTWGPFHHTALAFQYALSEGADVMNMSFSLPGLGDFRGVWRMMADHATAAGLVLVSGAGNFRRTASVPVQLRTPEDIPSVTAVGGVDASLRVVPFSSMGPVEWASVRFYGTPASLVKPDLAAFPGPGYPLLRPDGPGYISPNTSFRGNSFSAPHVAAAAALVLSAVPELPAWRVKEILEATARGDGAKDNDVGFGPVDAEAAVRAATEGTQGSTAG